MSYPGGVVQVSDGEEATMHQVSIKAVRSEALFVSSLQRSDNPSAGQVQQAIARAVKQFGSRGCAARVAQEFGDHPELAAARMRWACDVVDAAFRVTRPEAGHVHWFGMSPRAHAVQAAA
jgi:hypothetical protein